MRPKSIVLFERVYVASVTVGYVVTLIRTSMSSLGQPARLITVILMLIIPVTLALIVSRRRTRGALALLIPITWLLGMFYFASLYLVGTPSLSVTVSIALQAVAMAATLLPFTPSARAWLKAPRTAPISPDALKRTFD